MTITCDSPTAHYPSGCDLLKAYDDDNDGYINDAESMYARNSFGNGKITKEEMNFVTDCHRNWGGSIKKKCPKCHGFGPVTPVTCDSPTAHYPSGCDLLKAYDTNGDGKLDLNAGISITMDYTDAGKITIDEYDFLRDCWQNGRSIKKKCPKCYGVGPKSPAGDITKVDVNSNKVPEGSTIEWTKNKTATLKIHFRNTGNAQGTFTITVTDENNTTLCSGTTDSIPADGSMYYVECGSFTPSTVGTKTITVTIKP